MRRTFPLRATENESAPMRELLYAVILVAAGAIQSAAQTSVPSKDLADRPRDCPPGVSQQSPSRSDKALTEKLADSGGVLCPPAGVDPDMHVKPQEGGAIRVIPPPSDGSPGGTTNMRPK